MADRYRPLLDRIGSPDDLHDLLWELQGEMGTSHTGMRPPAAGGDPALAQGLLGADVEPAEDGTWRIARILPGESSVIGARSPLAAPGVAAAPGDLIVAVDGRPVDPDLGPNALLAGQGRPAGRAHSPARRSGPAGCRGSAGERARDPLLRSGRPAAGRGPRGLRRAARLPEHPGHDGAGWAEFHRDLYTEFRRDGLIVDLRDTQGGDARAAGGREARPAHHRLERVPVRGAVELPGRGAARADRSDHGRVRDFRRRPRDPGAEVLRHRDRGRHPYLGRRASAVDLKYSWSTGPWWRSRSTPSGLPASAGRWRTTAWIRTSR